MGALFGLCFEALILVDGVVELREGVAHLAAADEHLIALGERGLLGAALGQRADLHGVHGDECRLDERGLDLLVERLIERVAPRVGNVFHVHARALGEGDCRVRVAEDGHEVRPRDVLDSVGHGHAAPARREVHIVAQPLELIRAENLLGRAGEDALEDVHHAVEVGIGLIELTGRELRIVLGVHALVAEDAADLIHALNAADDQALEVQLGRNAHIHINVKRVVVRDERARRRAAGDGAEHGGLDLHEAQAVQIAAQIGHEPAADLEIALALRVHDEIHIALAVAQLRVRHAMELLRQRAQGLAEQRDLLHVDGDLPGLGLEGVTAHADDIADVILAEIGKLLLGDGVLADVELDLAAVVLNVAEDGLAHAALGHDAAGGLQRFAVIGVKIVLDIRRIGATLKACLHKGVAPGVLQRLELVAAHLKDLGQGRLCRRLLVLSLFVHDGLLSLRFRRR